MFLFQKGYVPYYHMEIRLMTPLSSPSLSPSLSSSSLNNNYCSSCIDLYYRQHHHHSSSSSSVSSSSSDPPPSPSPYSYGSIVIGVIDIRLKSSMDARRAIDDTLYVRRYYHS